MTEKIETEILNELVEIKTLLSLIYEILKEKVEEWSLTNGQWIEYEQDGKNLQAEKKRID